MKDKKILYRYEIQYSSSDGPTNVCLRQFDVMRETEHIYFIVKGDRVLAHILGRKEKKVKKNAYSTYAYDTKQAALEHFVRRTYKRISWFEYWIEECNKALQIVVDEKVEK